MADARSRLEYLVGNATWTKADTDQGSSGGTLGTGSTAVVKLKVFQKLNFPSTAHILLFNKAPNPLSSSTPSDSKGRLTGIFTNFMQCRIIEEETGLVTFRGRVYNVEERWDSAYGSVIDLVLKDALAELQGYPMDAAPDSLASIDINNAAYDKRSEIIAYIISQIGVSGNILTTNPDLFEPSLATFGASSGLTFDLTDTKDSALKVIHDLASSDAHVSTGDSKTVGWDYYMDTNTTTSATNVVSVPNLNYFSRGTRPGPGGQTGTSSPIKDPAKYSLTLELPADDWAGDTAFKRAMGNDAEFERPNDEIYTSVNLRYQESNEDSGGSTKGIVRKVQFEVLNGNVSAVFPLSFPTSTGKSIDVSNTDAATHPNKLYILNNAVPVATVQYRSGTGAGSYLLLSDITTSGSAIFPTAASNHTLYTIYNDNSSPSITFHGVTDRPSKSFGIQKPSRMQVKTLAQYDKLRRQVIGNLVKSSTETVRGQFSTAKFPYFYIEADNDNITQSTNTLNFVNSLTADPAVAAFANADASARTNDVREFGVKVGMVIAEIDSANTAGITRYAYISTITQSGTRITYGTGEDDTSDGSPIVGGNDIRIFIPLHAGDVVFTKNRVSDITSNQLIVEIEHEEEIGVSLCTLKTVGNNTTGAAIPLGDASGAPPSIIGKAIEGVTDTHSSDSRGYSTQATFSTPITATVGGVVSPNVIEWGYGTAAANVLTVGERYSVTMIDSNSTTANGGSPLSVGTYAMIYRPGNTIFSFIVSTEAAPYLPQDEDIAIAWIKIKAAGQADIEFASTLSIGSSNSYDAADVIQPATLNSLQLTEGARGFETDLKIFGGVVSRVRTELSANILATTLDVTNGDGNTLFIQSAGNNKAYIKVDAEIMEVTGRGANSLTVVRAQEQTTAAIHVVTSNVFQEQAQTISAYKELSGETSNRSDPTADATVRYADDATNQAFSISAISKAKYYHNDTNVIQTGSSTATLFSPNNEKTTLVVYCDISASDQAVSLKASTDLLAGLEDSVLQLAILTISPYDGTTFYVDGPGVFPSNSKSPMISASVISANAILAGSIKAGQITGDHLQADLILGTNIIAVDTDVGSATEHRRIKLIPGGLSSYASASTSDTSHRWFLLDRDNESLQIGRPAGGSPGMEATLKLNEHGVEFGSRSDSELTSGLTFSSTVGGTPQGKIWLYSGDTDNDNTGGIDAYYGIVQKGMVFSTYVGAENSMTFHFNNSGLGVYPADGVAFSVLTGMSHTDAPATVYTLKATSAVFDAGMVGRKITRIDTANDFAATGLKDVITTGVVTGFTSTSVITTSFNGWTENASKKFKITEPTTQVTSDFGRVGLGVAQGSEYLLPRATVGTPPHKYSHGNPHRVWGNMAAYTFEGSALRLWQKRSADIWSNSLDADPYTLGGYTEFGYAHNANSPGDSYKISFPHPDAETSIQVGDVLAIETYETATTSTYPLEGTGIAMGDMTAAMTDSQTFMLIESTSQASVGSTVQILNEQNAPLLEAGVTVTAITSATRLEIARAANPQAVTLPGGLTARIAVLITAAIDGSKDRPYRMKLKWNTTDGEAGTSILKQNSLTNFLESLLYG